MAKRIWESEAVSVIVLPSGDQGRAILDLAQDWSRSWLLTPALWMLADEIPHFDANQDIDLQVPPKLSAYLLGRDSEQNSVKEEVDVFWTLGSQAFKTIRFIAVRTEQDPAMMERTSIGAETAARFIQRSVPIARDLARAELTGALFSKYNLVIAPTNERRVLEGVLSQFWDANLIAAAEDRSTPLSTDSFVKVGERFTGFALAHIATTAGLWAGLPVSSAEISSEKSQLRQARLQRVFVRGVTSDSLSADVAHWALQKLNYADTNFELGAVEGRNVTTIAAERQEYFMNGLVEHILKGSPVDEQEDNFLYTPFESSPYATHKAGWSKRILERMHDMAAGLAAIPAWLSASAQYRLNIALDDEKDEKVLYDAIPKRLAPRVKLPPVDVLIASLKPKLPLPTPELWRHMRESLSSAIDAPTSNHPDVLKDKDGRLLVFATVDQVLPDPDTVWKGDKYVDKTMVKFEEIGWLDAASAHEITRRLQVRSVELAPGIEDARAQLSETQRLVDEAEKELKKVGEDLGLIEGELNADIRESKKSKTNHTHKLPNEITEAAMRKKHPHKTSTHKQANGKHSLSIHTDIPETPVKRGFFKRIFSRRKKSA
jgi:hypothetical protein